MIYGYIRICFLLWDKTSAWSAPSVALHFADRKVSVGCPKIRTAQVWVYLISRCAVDGQPVRTLFSSEFASTDNSGLQHLLQWSLPLSHPLRRSALPRRLLSTETFGSSLATNVSSGSPGGVLAQANDAKENRMPSRSQH